MNRHWLIAIVIIACTSCGGDDTNSSPSTDALVSGVASVRARAAATGDTASFTAATTDLRATIAAMHDDAELSDEKTTAILLRLAAVESEFGRTLPTTTTVGPTTTLTTSTVAPTSAVPSPAPKGKGKKAERDDDD